MNQDNKKLTAIALSVVIVIALTGCDKKQKSQPLGSVYPTMIVVRQPAILQAVYPVTIKGTEDVDIKPRVEGFIETVFVDEGTMVKKGQALFKISSPQAEQSYAAAQATMLSAQAQLNTAKVNVDRIRPLAEKGIVSNTQLLTYENAYQIAAASVKQAEATLNSAETTRGWTTVTSPVDGVVGIITYRAGSLVNSSSIITTVSSVDNVFAYFSLNENVLRSFLNKASGTTQTEKIKNLPPVTLQLSDGTDYPDIGKIETISGVVNVSTGSANFRAEFPNRQGQLRSGYSGQIIIPETVEDALVIPQKATFAQQDKILLYKVKDGIAMQAVVKVREMPDGKSYLVTEGLTEGDRIVTDGVATLTDGKEITSQDNRDNIQTKK